MPASKRSNATTNKTLNQGDSPSYAPASSSRASSHHATPDNMAASPPHRMSSEDCKKTTLLSLHLDAQGIMPVGRSQRIRAQENQFPIRTFTGSPVSENPLCRKLGSREAPLGYSAKP